MPVLKRSLEIDAPANEVWRVLTTPELVREWAAAYDEGIQIRTSFREGEPVTWKGRNGATRSCGTVAACKPERLLRFEYDGDARGMFSDTFEISETDHKTRLDFTSGPLHHIYMNMILSPHNVTLTEAIENHLISRINKLDHLNHYATNTRVVLEHDKTKAPERQFSCSLRVSLPGPDLFAVHHDQDLYAAIDVVAKKIEQQLRKRHNKYKARKHKVAARTKRTRQSAGM